MFGYVRPRKDELKIRDYQTYRAAYCGLCRAMSRRYGFRARFLVNYDMTFLYLLRESVRKPAEQRSCHCPARIFGKERCVCDDAGFEKVSAYNVVLSYHKLRDNVRDSSWFRSIPFRAASFLFRRAYRKASREVPEFDRLVRNELDKLSRMEKEKCASIDATADTFAKLTAGCAADLPEASIRRPTEAVLYQTGRFIYLADALDDLSEDCKKNTYNPLRFRFPVENGKLSEEDQDYLSQLTDSSVNLAGAALELLPVQTYLPLLENIVYLGLPAVFSAVRRGDYNHRKKDHPRKERFE